jgi:intein/homing endonuclease
MTEIEKAYIAGFFDGEGSASIMRAKHKDCRFGFSFSPVVYIANTNLDILKEIQKMIAAGSIYHCKKVAHHKNAYSLHIHGQHAKDFLKMISPYLKIKKEVAKEVSDFASVIKGQHRTASEFNSQQLVFNRVKLLNKKGD